VEASAFAHVDERTRRSTVVPAVRLGELELSFDDL
jgi:hypothetical protein